MRECGGLFITATGTSVGKTLVCTIVCHQLTHRGYVVRALKPVVSGFSPKDPSSDPSLILQSLGHEPTAAAIAEISPWRFGAPLSPHLAARLEGRALGFSNVAHFCRDQERNDCDLLLIEGAGGVMSPIDDSYTFLELIADLGHPVILVTGSYLGAISHALTALSALDHRGIDIRAVVVSESEPSAGLIETVESVSRLARAGLPLYTLPRIPDGSEPKWRRAGSLLDALALLNRS
jgi:dethiobiotin synthetase